MSTPRMKVATLDQESLDRLQAFEEEMNFFVVALEPKYKLADLSAEQVERIRAIEQDLGLVLLAYRK